MAENIPKFSYASIIPAAASMLEGGANVISTILTNKHNERMQERINERNERLQREMNAYNSPVSQMMRYRSAGINPMAADVSGGLQTTLPEQVAPQYEAPTLSGLADAANNSISYNLNKTKTENQVKYNDAKVLETVARTGSINQQVAFGAALFGLQKQEYEQRIANSRELFKKTQAEINLLFDQSKTEKERAKTFQSQQKVLYKQVGLLDSQTLANYSIIENTWHHNFLLDAQTVGFNIRNSADAETAKYTIAYYGSLNKRGFADLLAKKMLISTAYDLLSLPLQRKMLYNTSVVGYNQALYSNTFYKYQSQNMISVAGQNWDEWQQGQARKNFRAYVVDPLNAAAGLLQSASGAYKIFNGLNVPSMFPDNMYGPVSPGYSDAINFGM